MYNKTVMDHFRNPRNVGVIEDADGVGEVGNPLCGDMMTIYLKIEDDHIKDIKFQTFGCGSAIAVSSMLTEMAKGKNLRRPKALPIRMSPMPWRACQKTSCTVPIWALMPCTWPSRIMRIRRPGKTRAGAQDKHEHTHGDKCYCPYCDIEIFEGATFCEACQTDLEEHH